MRNRGGFTLFEVLTCMAIIATVAGILTPVFRMVKHSAQVTSSLSNLHQIHLAIMVYQSSEGTTAQYGTLSQMGLPNAYQLDALILPNQLKQSPCTLNPNWFPYPISWEYEYFASTSRTPWESAVANYGDNSMLFVDMNCADHGDPLLSDYIDHLGLGVELSGTLVNRHNPGDYHVQEWWLGPPSNPNGGT